MYTEAVLSLGGNKGNREFLLAQAVEALRDQFDVTKLSDIYETGAWGGVAEGNFLNQIAVILTEKNPEEVLRIIQAIEKNLGRKRDEHWGDRTMDIDILYFGDRILDTGLLKVPHPFLAKRRFVLVPLASLLPEKKHPITHKSSIEMLAECEDESEVSVYVK